ncbi:MAG: hypothetical protein M1832_002339 [Thelocarpon impressellum]|nr:MAG: hypothetical protein M1832_002339 [Thelocarpon impressellum]
MRSSCLLLLPLALGTVKALENITLGYIQLTAAIVPLNTTHIVQSIANPNAFDISILTYDGDARVNTLAAALIVVPVGNVSAARLKSNPTRSGGAASSTYQYHSIKAGWSMAEVQDITDLFDVPVAGNYNVILNLQTSGFRRPYDSNTTEGYFANPGALFIAEPAVVEMKLATSKEISRCKGVKRSLLRFGLGGPSAR